MCKRLSFSVISGFEQSQTNTIQPPPRPIKICFKRPRFRVNNRCAELEQINDLEKENANTLKESQCDIIAYLSRQAETKNNEIIDLENTISTLKTVFINYYYIFIFYFCKFSRKITHYCLGVFMGADH